MEHATTMCGTRNSSAKDPFDSLWLLGRVSWRKQDSFLFTESRLCCHTTHTTIGSLNNAATGRIIDVSSWSSATGWQLCVRQEEALASIFVSFPLRCSEKQNSTCTETEFCNDENALSESGIQTQQLIVAQLSCPGSASLSSLAPL